MQYTKPTVAGLFAGCGGLDYGFQQAGFELVWANEKDSDAAFSYKKLTGQHVVVNDIWNIFDQIPSVDILLGGPPCQSFSLVGKRLQDDPRSTLVFAYLHAVERIRPSVFVMENVPGLMASTLNSKRLPLYLAECFAKIGYTVCIQKILATNYFVPQKRQRVFMIGIKKPNTSFQMISSEEFASILDVPFSNQPVPVSDALDDLPTPLAKGETMPVMYASPPHSLFAMLMRCENLPSVSLHTMPTMSALDREFVNYIPPGGNYRHIPDEISTKRIMAFKLSGGRTTTYGRLHPAQPAYTINTFFNRPNVGANYHHTEERLITVREAMRLQSFPDHFCPNFKSQRSLHMQIGNAVPPLMAQAVAESIKKIMS